MRIAFDGTTLRPGRTGVGYYTEHLLRAVIEQGAEHDVVVVSNRPLDLTRPLPGRVHVECARWAVPQLVWMQTLAPRLVARLRPDVVHFTNGMMPLVCGAPAVVTIHDMSLTLYPRFHPPRRVLLNRPLVDAAARRADAIIAVSHAARRDIVRHYGLAPDRVHVVSEAAAPQYRPIRDPARLDAVRRRYRLADRFILYVGTIEPRKNLPLLLHALAGRAGKGDLPHQLVCVGPYGWLCRDVASLIARLGLEHRVRFTGYVPFDDLPAVYSLAEMLVFPSLYEGFGLPVIEAMACGTPVVTGRVGALVEVGGEALEQVAHLDPDALGDAMLGLAHDPERRADLSARGLKRAATFSWQRAARDTLAVYEHVVAGRHARPRLVDATTTAADHQPEAPPASVAMDDILTDR
jgi:glycosyltransferase involved in cell wall biosynthesis